MSEFEFDKEEFKKNVVNAVNSRYFRQLLIRSRII